MTKRVKLKCNEACVVCETKPAEYHHLKSFGSGGSDHIWNLMPLCRKHHRFTHDKGLRYMARRSYEFEKALIEKKWEFNDHLERWMNYEPEIRRVVNKTFL